MRLRARNLLLAAGCALLISSLFAATPGPPHGAATLVDGEAIYLSRCMSCHQINGGGIAGVFPPLNGTDWVIGDKGRLIRITLDGLMGETEVQGVVYSGAMPPWKSFLSDDEVAAVLTYIRSAWDNSASPVTPQEVNLVRTASKDRTTPWTAEELKEQANLGIPGAFEFLTPPADTSGNR